MEALPAGEGVVMTDLEITKLCAEAMGINFREADGHIGEDIGLSFLVTYEPLTNDAQAMALVKRARLCITSFENLFSVTDITGGANPRFYVEHTDLNRAICECVAKMQQAKK